MSRFAEKSRFADEIRRAIRGIEYSVIQLYNDGVVKAVTFAYLVY